jgi:hypothetical protein
MENVSANKKVGWPIYAAGIAIAAAPIAVVLNWGAIVGALSAGYTCESMVPEIVKISESNAAPGAPRVIGVVGVSTVSTASDRVECTGAGVLSTAVRVPLNYSGHIEDGQWWIVYKPAE